MNSNQVKRDMKEAASKVRAKTPELLWSNPQQVKGVTKEAEDKSSYAAGKPKETPNKALAPRPESQLLSAPTRVGANANKSLS